MKDDNKKLLSLSMSAFIGGVVFASLFIILLAPKYGKEIRQKTSEYLSKFSRKRDKEEIIKNEAKQIHSREEKDLNWFERLIS